MTASVPSGGAAHLQGIELRDCDRGNWLACTRLQVTEEQLQHFPAPVVYWLAESKFEPDFHPLAAYSDGELVGFVVCSRDPEDGEYWIMALMIDRRFQRRGLGRATVLAAVDWMRRRYGCRRIYLGHRPQNGVAASLYESLGFRECGRSDAEVIRCLALEA